MSMNPSSSNLPELEMLDALAQRLRADRYVSLQTVPYADHDPAFARDHLPSLLAEEQHLLVTSRAGGPIIYSHSLCRAHYARKLGPKLILLGNLFLYNKAVAVNDVRALAPEYLEFIEQDSQGMTRWNFRLVPLYELLLLADPLNATAEDRVFLHHDSIRMARRVRESLVLQGMCVADIGTGSGIIAAVAAQRGARRVIAVDINPRALSFARINLELNALSNVELRLGSVEQLVDEADVLLSNPPYMQGRTALCLDGAGADGLDIARRFIAAAQRCGKPLAMVLELEQPHVATLSAVLQAPHLQQTVLRRIAGRELLWCDFPA